MTTAWGRPSIFDVIAKTRSYTVKFQTHTASAETTPEEPWRIKFSRQGATATTTGDAWTFLKNNGAVYARMLQIAS